MPIKTMLRALILATVVVFSGCTQEFGGEGGRTAVINEQGRDLYNAQCASCHGPNGDGGSGGALIACATCGNEASLIAKIERDMPSSANPMHGGDAADTAEYIMVAFNEHANGKVERSLPGVATLTPNEAVYKLAFELAGRLPTDTEVTTFGRDLDGEKAVVYGFMETDYFYERLKDMFNDSMLTDYARRENTNSGNSVENLFASFESPVTVGQNADYDVYPDLNWEQAFVDAISIDGKISTTYLDYFTDEALGRRPMLLVEYLARNNRNFKEFVSGKYTVVNRFSYEALGGDRAGSHVKIVNPDLPLANGASTVVTNPQWATFKNVAEVEDYLEVVELYGDFGNRGSVNTSGDHYVVRDFPFDPRDIKPAQLFYNDDSGNAKTQGVPHSGVLTDEVFLHKYTATETNKHRNRARMVYWFFAAKDLLAIEGNRNAELLEFEDFGNNVGETDPTNSNPDCLVCHEIMDVVAAAFENYSLTGVYDIRNPDNVPDHDLAISWGLSSAKIKTTGTIDQNYYSRELQWLGEQVANDPAYSRGIAQMVLKGLTGQDILGEPSQDSPQTYIQAYKQQARLIVHAASEFETDDFNIKALIYAISKSAYYRSTGMFYNDLAEDYSQIGSLRYLPPQLLNQKLRALNSGGWDHSLSLDELNSRMFMGGKNSTDVFRDADSVSGIISAVTERMAVEEACDIVRNEFGISRLERTLFKLVDDSTDLNASSASARLGQYKAVRSTIAQLYLAVLHQEVASDSEEVDIAFDLFQEVLQADVNSSCNTGGGTRAVREAWYAVLVYMLTDYRFIYS
ncbi:c-type cytochrome [Reinekea sp.]|jgi:hypothetical protein|uniref:c-type cytochrome n=1 Tax=Reinekea sp. TaxID=1970455 RepID=UPI002A81D87D|nr:c-type cytochrome [Reinekea sp.]